MARKGAKRRIGNKTVQPLPPDDDDVTPSSDTKANDDTIPHDDTFAHEPETDKHDDGNFSDEDEGDEDDDNNDENDGSDEVGADDENESDDENQIVNENEMDNEEPDIELTTGMANAMARILGGESFASKPASETEPKPDKPVVLSKTKTPLQVQAAKEEKARRELLETRRLHKEKRELTALHIPLSVATARIFDSSGDSKGLTVSAELEQERMHRRVATRGIVVLFNAIATHQVNPTQTAEAAAEAASATNTKAKASKLTKHGFLDLIKQTAAAKANAATSGTADAKGTAGTKAKTEDRQWNALKDDYMLDSKKNWDEEDDESLENEEPERPALKKRHKAR